jgi:hypothetical protein
MEVQEEDKKNRQDNDIEKVAITSLVWWLFYCVFSWRGAHLIAGLVSNPGSEKNYSATRCDSLYSPRITGGWK